MRIRTVSLIGICALCATVVSFAQSERDVLNTVPSSPVQDHAGVSRQPIPETSGTYIDFNDGVPRSPIGGFYSGLGVTFSNAQWWEPIPNQDGTPSEGISLVDVTDNGPNPPFTPTETTPIVGVFDVPVGTVSILAYDVGHNGATLRVYDAPVGGNVLGSDTFFGVEPAGVGEFDTLIVTAPGILRFELFQPVPEIGDGCAFDNLFFDLVIPVELESFEIEK